MSLEPLPYRYDPVENVFRGGSGVISGWLPHVMWHITDVCPLGCPFCFAPKSTSTIELDHARRVASLLAGLGVQKVDISGGEPLAAPILPGVVELVVEGGAWPTLTTSGVGSAVNRKWVVENVGRFSRLIVSLDAPNEASHNKLRRHPMAWRGVDGLCCDIEGAERIRALRVNTVVTKTLLETDGWLPQFLDVLARWQVREWCVIEPHPANKKPTYDEHAVAFSEFEAAVSTIQEVAMPFKLLTRRADMYSTYWAIHPDATLRQHTEGPSDRNVIDLLANTATEIRARVRETTTIIPMEGDGNGTSQQQ